MNRHSVLDVAIDDLSDAELSNLLDGWLNSAAPAKVIVTPNPEFLLAARRDAGFRDALNRADLSLPDGVGLRFAVAALTDGRLMRRHTGVDTLEEIAILCTRSGKELILLGGESGVAEAAARSLAAEIPGLAVRGIDPGRVEPETFATERRMDELDRAAVVAVGLGQGKQERVMEILRTCAPANLPDLRILIGVGGAFDMIAGTKRRAPRIARRVGLEWLWRLAIEPSRWRRIFSAFPVFPAVVIFDTLRHRRFLRATRATIPEIIRQIQGL
ncbi:WecB/TagA/CpsF family glycosyltransferase [bacterium]|nr:WecB/TagA/CpsF family glycosyltransferase [bacterium]